MAFDCVYELIIVIESLSALSHVIYYTNGPFQPIFLTPQRFYEHHSVVAPTRNIHAAAADALRADGKNAHGVRSPNSPDAAIVLLL